MEDKGQQNLEKLSPSELAEKRAWIRNALSENETALLRYTQGILGGDIDNAQEVVQEAFLRLWDRAPDDVKGYAREWLFRVCRNLSIDRKRKESRVSAQELNLDLQVDETTPSVEDQLDHKKRHAVVESIIEKLKPQQQEILRLKFQEGMTYHEISRITGHSISHIGVLIFNITKKIRKNFEKQIKKEQRLKVISREQGSLE